MAGTRPPPVWLTRTPGILRAQPAKDIPALNWDRSRERQRPAGLAHARVSGAEGVVNLLAGTSSVSRAARAYSTTTGSELESPNPFDRRRNWPVPDGVSPGS